jgi:predicted secreted hydrolase
MANARGNAIIRIAAALLAFLLSLMPSSLPPRAPERDSPGETMPFSSVSKTLRKIANAFPGDRADRPMVFPFDHGAHPNAPMDIWEFTGQMHAPDGHRYGFQLSITRLGLQPDHPARPSAWATRDVYRGLLGLLDASGGHYRASERFARAALGMSGYDPASGRVWLDDWTIQLPSGEATSFNLQAEAEGTRLDLRLASQKPAVLPVTESFPAASAGSLRAYMLSRMAISGTVQSGEHRHRVAGRGWLNRSWGKMAPPGGQVALNRYQVQLDDGRELLIFQLRRKDGSAPPLSSGFLIETDGRVSPISRNDVRLEPDAYWSNPAGTRYPVGWTIKLPNLETELHLSPLVENQEAVRSVRSWAGSVSVSGAGPRGEALAGQGFMELTGY